MLIHRLVSLMQGDSCVTSISVQILRGNSSSFPNLEKARFSRPVRDLGMKGPCFFTLTGLGKTYKENLDDAVDAC